jgi:paraquat-inducible protein A
MTEAAATGEARALRGTPRSNPAIVECHDCGAHYALPALAPGSSAVCPRCGALLRRCGAQALDRTLAYSLCGLILIALANLMPFMSLSIEGRIQSASLISGAEELLNRGLWLLATAVIATTVVAPLAKIGAMVYVLLGLRLKTPPPFLPLVFRWVEWLSPWAMIEVYMLGAFVAYVKLVDLATIHIGTALYAVAMLMIAMGAASAALDTDAVWEEMARRGLVPALAGARRGRRAGCAACGLVVAASAPHLAASCPRCSAALHRRKPDSLARTWALVIAAAILYIPANVYPVMTVIYFGKGAPDTILTGVRHLFEGGMWPLALLVFFASVTVPLLKLVGLTFLLISVRRRSGWRLRDRATLYRVVDAVGRWSMIDIFMLSILVALVRLGSIASVEPGAGATCFAGVVVITMAAAMTFDPRLMWDAAGENHD